MTHPPVAALDTLSSFYILATTRIWLNCAVAVYRSTGWGQPVGIGATGPVFAQVSAICKKNGASPYFVANELVASELGRILRLPVPPGFIVLDSNQTAHYASLDFNLTGVALPPIIPGDFIARFQPDLALIVVFDIFIANSDRHPGNLSADYNPPPRFNLFDHSHALLGAGAPNTGIACLQGAQPSIVVNANHAVIAGVNQENLLLAAIERVESIPNYYIEDAVREASGYGLSGAEAQELRDFLVNRKGQLRHLISTNHGLFPAITHWGIL